MKVDVVGLLLVFLLSITAFAQERRSASVSSATNSALTPHLDADDTSSTSDESSPMEEFAVELPADRQDAAFDRYVDILLVAQAVDELDAELLTDVGLQLAEGERVLLRPHHAISSDQVLRFARKVAVDEHNGVALARLQKVADKLGKAELAASVEESTKLAGDSRTLDPGAMIAIDRVATNEFALLKYYSDAIRRARLFGDADALKELRERLTHDADLPTDRKDILLKVVSESRSQASVDKDGDAKQLLLLSSASRGWFEDVTGGRAKTPRSITQFDPGPAISGPIVNPIQIYTGEEVNRRTPPPNVISIAGKWYSHGNNFSGTHYISQYGNSFSWNAEIRLQRRRPDGSWITESFPETGQGSIQRNIVNAGATNKYWRSSGTGVVTKYNSQGGMQIQWNNGAVFNRAAN